MTEPLGSCSIALGLHPSAGDAAEAVDLLCRQAGAAEEHGFDGVTLSEHHGGFPTYLPVPALVAGRLLAATHRIWAGPCPTILPLRHPVAVVEELAWLAASHPGRVGAGFVAGYQERDYEIFGAAEAFPGRLAAFAEALPWVCAALGGSVEGVLGADPAVNRLAIDPVAVVVGTGGPVGARRAAEAGAGLLVTSTTPADEARTLVEAYRHAGGSRPCFLVRRVWLGEPPRSVEEQLSSYRTHDTAGTLTHRRADDVVLSGTADAVATRLADDCVRAGVDGLNLRAFAPDAPGDLLVDQIETIGDAVLPAVRRSLGWLADGR